MLKIGSDAVLGSHVGPGSRFGPGNGPITLDEVQCTGDEERLADCSTGVVEHNCVHFEDAGVRCRMGEFSHLSILCSVSVHRYTLISLYRNSPCHNCADQPYRHIHISVMAWYSSS